MNFQSNCFSFFSKLPRQKTKKKILTKLRYISLNVIMLHYTTVSKNVLGEKKNY